MAIYTKKFTLSLESESYYRFLGATLHARAELEKSGETEEIRTKSSR